jgi:putative phage-type endonuclease
MTAVLVLPGTAPEEEWLDRRRQGVTASEIPVLMGLVSGEWGSPYKLYWQKTGDLPADDQSDRLRLGHVLEPYIAGRFMERRPEFCISGGRALYAHPERPWQLATPDRLVQEGPPSYGLVERDGIIDVAHTAVLECKSWGTFDGWGPDGSDEIPVHIRAQALWQADVMQVTTAYVACVFLPGGQLRVYELTMDRDAWNDVSVMIAEAQLFLQRVAERRPPDVDWRPATADALKRLHPSVLDEDVTIPKGMARAYQAAVSRHKTAEQRKQLMENRVRERLGTGHRAVTPDGQPIARRDVYDLAEKTITRKAATVDRLVAVKPKEAK